MGVLDDAIREHLELKRKHGAAEEELRRQEEEALGPARREVGRPEDEPGPPSSGDGAVDEEEAAEEPGREPEAPFGVTDEPEGREEPLHLAGAAESERDESLRMAEEPEETERRYPQLEPKGDHPPEDPSFDPESDIEESEGRTGDRPPGGFTEVDPDEDEDEGDVLEDTPDFLQETPEHDRLWFEQKPPRDFDFD
jgi:hypothetical protein